MDNAVKVAKQANTDIFRMKRDEELTPEKLKGFVERHEARRTRYLYLKNMYESKHDILFQQNKGAGKPDNRLVTNYAKYMVDTFEGYFLGIPIKTAHETELVEQYIERVQQLNDQDDNNSELSKFCSIFGHAYELLYQNEGGDVGITYISPLDGFIIYDDSVRERPIYGVRYGRDEEDKINGSYSDASKIVYFNNEMRSVGEEPHYFGDVPLIEYVQNRERQGVFESVITLIADYNQATSEKSNDVAYFADAYMSLIGTEVDEEQLANMRESRFINISGEPAEEVALSFLEKPNADTTQENHIKRLKEDIFTISMIANISDENFGNASGISLAYKLHAMSNLAGTKERKFVSSMNRRYKLIENYPGSIMTKDDWAKVKYTFKRNMPKNIAEEATVAQALRGVVSHDTILNNLSVVDNSADEMKKIDKENERNSLSLELPNAFDEREKDNAE